MLDRIAGGAAGLVAYVSRDWRDWSFADARTSNTAQAVHALIQQCVLFCMQNQDSPPASVFASNANAITPSASNTSCCVPAASKPATARTARSSATSGAHAAGERASTTSRRAISIRSGCASVRCQRCVICVLRASSVRISRDDASTRGRQLGALTGKGAQTHHHHDKEAASTRPLRLARCPLYPRAATKAPPCARTRARAARGVRARTRRSARGTSFGARRGGRVCVGMALRASCRPKGRRGGL